MGGARVREPVAEQVISALSIHSSIDSVVLVGSRQRVEPSELSDWDFKVETRDFRSLAGALPTLVAPLEPLAQQWDRLSAEQCYMLMLPGAVKVDLIFDEPHVPEPPWEVSAKTLKGIDGHFWDWIIWLVSKDMAGRRELVVTELRRMHEHLLGPLGVVPVPSSVKLAVVSYIPALRDAEVRLAVQVPRDVEHEVLDRLVKHRYAF